MRKLVSAADHERVKRITRLELRSAIPIEARLRNVRGSRLSLRSRESTIMSHRSCSRIILGRDELHVVTIQVEIVERLLNEIGIFVAHVAELHSWDANVHDPIAGVTVPRRLEPSVV